MTDAKADELIAVLTRIADALEAPPMQAAPARPAPGECDHPASARVRLGDINEWECSEFRGGCGYRSPALTVAAVPSRG